MAAEEKEEQVRKVKRSSKKSGKEKIQKGEQGETVHGKKAGTFDIWAAAKFEKVEKEEIIPLPDPETLKVLEQFAPGEITKILETTRETIISFNEINKENAKTDNEIRKDIVFTENEINKKNARSERIASFFGPILGFFIAALFLLAAWDLINKGHDTAGTVLGTIDIVALVTVFITGRKN